MSGYIDNYGGPDNPVLDITGTTLNAVLNFADKGASAPTDHSLAGLVGLPGVTSSLLTLLNTPLSAMGDLIWATRRDRTASQIISQISSSVKGLGGGFSAYNIRVVSLPTTGTLYALVLSGSLTNPNASQVVLLSYQLTNITALFTVTTPFTGGRFPFFLPDPDYKLTFDVEFLVSIVIPLGVGTPPSVASFNVENAHISADNFTAVVGDTIVTAINALGGRPTDIFQGAEGQIDTSGNASDQLAALATLLSQLGTFWSFASGTLGFKQLSAFIGSPPALNLRFTHPLDGAPVVQDGTVSPFPSLFHPQLGTSA